MDLIKKQPKSPEEDFKYLVDVLHFQIAELNRMKSRKLQEQGKYFGVESASGHHWYNFEAFANIEAGVRGYLDNISIGTHSASPVTWRTLGEVIELGRIYE